MCVHSQVYRVLLGKKLNIVNESFRNNNNIPMTGKLEFKKYQMQKEYLYLFWGYPISIFISCR